MNGNYEIKNDGIPEAFFFSFFSWDLSGSLCSVQINGITRRASVRHAIGCSYRDEVLGGSPPFGTRNGVREELRPDGTR
jgi:hypothetical protein